MRGNLWCLTLTHATNQVLLILWPDHLRLSLFLTLWQYFTKNIDFKCVFLKDTNWVGKRYNLYSLFRAPDMSLHFEVKICQLLQIWRIDLKSLIYQEKMQIPLNIPWSYLLCTLLHNAFEKAVGKWQTRLIKTLTDCTIKDSDTLWNISFIARFYFISCGINFIDQ